MDQIFGMVRHQKKKNSKIGSFQFGGPPQTGLLKFKLFNLLSYLHKIVKVSTGKTKFWCT